MNIHIQPPQDTRRTTSRLFGSCEDSLHSYKQLVNSRKAKEVTATALEELCSPEWTRTNSDKHTPGAAANVAVNPHMTLIITLAVQGGCFKAKRSRPDRQLWFSRRWKCKLLPTQILQLSGRCCCQDVMGLLLRLLNFSYGLCEDASGRAR